MSALLLLLLNDHLFKYSWPNFITGKLSDFSGLYLFPLFVNIFIRDKQKVFLGTALLFILWKSPLSQPFIDHWNNLRFYHIQRIVDYSDILAIAILPLAYCRSNALATSQAIYRPILKYVVGGFTFAAIVATAGTHGRIKRYTYDYSKETLSKALIQILDENPSYKLTDSVLKAHLDSYPLSSDTVNFHFYMPESKIGKVYWASFMGRNQDWKANKCNFDLIGVKMDSNKYLYEKDLSSQEKAYMIKIFESNIISKVDSLLKNQKE